MNKSRSIELNDESNIKQCKVCGENIKIPAKKCIHCSSFQDLRGFLPISSTLLALIIALISVAAAVGPTLKDLFVEKTSNIIVQLQDVDRESIYLIASNLGERDGSIGQTSLGIRTKKQKDLGLNHLLEKSRDETFIKALSGKQIRLTTTSSNIKNVRDLYFSWKLKDELSPYGIIKVDIISFNGDRRIETINLERVSLESFLNNSVSQI